MVGSCLLGLRPRINAWASSCKTCVPTMVCVVLVVLLLLLLGGSLVSG